MSKPSSLPVKVTLHPAMPPSAFTLSTNSVVIRTNAAGLMFCPSAADSRSDAENTAIEPSSAGQVAVVGSAAPVSVPPVAPVSAGGDSAGGVAGSAGGAAASLLPPHDAAPTASAIVTSAKS